MSLGYAEKLSYREDVGTVGMTELFDPSHILQEKIEQLAMMIKKSEHLVAFTGAGISTSCGIPDFRGPKGVWTLQRAGKGVPEASLPFDRAMPSLTHMALVELERVGILKFLISQNVDGLHLRSGILREKLSELHGNSFREICPSCEAEYIRDFEVETIGMKETSRRCTVETCGAKLNDTVLDWEDALPPKEMNAAEKHCKMADLVLCLGTSLQITPACNLPLKALGGGGEIVIVNLQPTPKDKKASLVIHGRVDKVIAGAMHLLNLTIPPYIRVDLIDISLCHFLKRKSKYVKWTLRIASVHGKKAPLPFLKSVEVSFPERPNLKAAILDEQPFLLKRETLKSRPFKMVLDLYFSEGCGCPCTRIEWVVDFQVARENFGHDKVAVLQKLRDTAIQDLCSGQYAAVERRTLSAPKTKATKSETTIYAIVTNIARQDDSSLKPVFQSSGNTTTRLLAHRGVFGGTTMTQALWNPVADKLFVDVMVDHMSHSKKCVGGFDSTGWNMIASEFNRRNGSAYDVAQLQKRFASLKRMFKSAKELLALSSFRWDESSKLVVAEPAAWDAHLQSHPDDAQFRTATFPAYEQMCVICSESESIHSPEIKVASPIPAKRNDDFMSEAEDGFRTPSKRSHPSSTPSHLHGIKREQTQHVKSEIFDSPCQMASQSSFITKQRASPSLSADAYSITSCVTELMKIEPLNPIDRVIASRHFENPNLREMFMVWGKEERIAWLEMIMKER